MTSLTVEILVSTTAGALMAVMVAAGAAMIADVPNDSAIEGTMRGAVNNDSLTFCFEDGERLRCIREES